MAMQVPNPFGVGVRGSSPANAGLVEAPGSSSLMNEFGKEAQTATKEFADSVKKWQANLDETKVKDMANQMQSLYTEQEDGENGYKRVLGRNAVETEDGKSLTETRTERFKQGVAEILKQAKNPAQKRAAQELADALTYKFRDSVNVWTVKQSEVWGKEVHDEKMRLATTMAVSDDEEEARTGLFVLRANEAERARIEGRTPDFTKVVGDAHAYRVGVLIDDFGAGRAKSYLSQNRSEMTVAQIKAAERAIKIKDDEERAIAISEEILSKFSSRKESRAAVDAVDEELRPSVRKLVDGEFARREKDRADQVSEIVDAIYDSFNHGAPVPTVLRQELMELDPTKYHDLFDGNGIFLELGKAPPVSDESVLRQLEAMHNDDIESFASLDLRRFATSLSKQDMTRITNLQKKSGDETYKAFKKELEFRIAAENLRDGEKSRVLAAADRMWEEAKKQKPNGAIDVASRQEMVKTLFTKTSGWGRTKGYKAILDNPSMTTSQALFDEGIYSNADIKGKADALLRRFGRPGWNDATVEQRRAASSLASGAGWPADVMDAARKELNEIKARKRANGETVNDEFDGYALELIMTRNVFGK